MKLSANTMSVILPASRRAVAVVLPALAALSMSAAALANPAHDQGKTKEPAAAHASAVGKPGDPAKVTRTVTIDMHDNMRFTPDKISVKKGETVKFVVKNSGKLKHEMVLGSMKELKEHGAMMRKMPEMEHADPNQVTLDPGKSGEIVWQFAKAGNYDFACLQPGHFEAGMKGKIAVK